MGMLDNILKGFNQAVLGAAPTDVGGAYSALQTELNSRYDQQKQAFEADPNNQGKQFAMPDALQRWNDEIQGMITSGDPTLQKEGLAQMSQYHQRATEAAQNTDPASVREWQALVQQGDPRSLAQYLAEKQSRGGTNVSVKVNSGTSDYIPTMKEAQEMVMPDGSDVPLGVPIKTLGQMGATFKKSEQQRAAGTAGDVLARVTENFNKTIDQQSGSKLEAGLNELRSRPGFLGEVADAGLSMAGVNMAPQAAQFMIERSTIANQTVKLMSGASATDQERENYQHMLPKYTDAPEIRRIKYKAAADYADSVIKQNRKAGVETTYDAPTGRVARKWGQ